MTDIIISESVNRWLNTGERGVSSETIVEVLTGLNLTGQHKSHPHDPADFRRCVLLLAQVPDFKPRMHEMSAESPLWAALVERWNEFEAMLYGGQWDEVYSAMKTMGC